jgi:hypothetical protein
MKKLSSEDIKILNEVTKYIPIKQQLILVWWDIFYPKKRELLFYKLQQGMSWYFAYTETKNS